MHDELLNAQEEDILSFNDKLEQEIGANSLPAQNIMKKKTSIASKSLQEQVEDVMLLILMDDNNTGSF